MESLGLVVLSVLILFALRYLSHLLRGSTTAIEPPLSTEAAFPSPSSSGLFSRDALFLWCSLFSVSCVSHQLQVCMVLFSVTFRHFFLVVAFPFTFPVVPGGRVAMIAVWTLLSPKIARW